jgi:hypothetical protein
MNFELRGRLYDYFIEDDKITILKKKDTIYTGNIDKLIILCFVEKNIFGAGQIALSLPNREKVFIDGFRKEHRNGFIELFHILKDKTEFLNLNYIKAIQYVKPKIRKGKELKEIAKEEQKKEKRELLKKL